MSIKFLIINNMIIDIIDYNNINTIDIFDIKKKNIIVDKNSISPENIDDLLLKLINDSDNEQIDENTQLENRQKDDVNISKYTNNKQLEFKTHTFNIVHNKNLKETEKD